MVRTDKPGVHGGTVVALGAMMLAVLLIANDFVALSVAIPKIEAEFDTTLNRAQWVINGYAVVFGVLIVTGGRLADLFGRRRMFILGAMIFGLFSLGGGLAPGIHALIASRALMGIGGALMWPAVLGMTYAMVPASRSGLAGGLVIGTAGVGNAIGPLLGGFLTDALSWRWVFFVNLPVAVLAILACLLFVPESRGDTLARTVDYRGIATLSVGVVAILVALDTGTQVGFGHPAILALFAISVVSIGLFVVVERREGDEALVPEDVMRNRQFTAAFVSVLVMSAIFFAALVYLPQFFEKQLGYSAVRAGAGLLPMMVTFAATSFVAGRLYDRLGAKVVVASGATLLGAGMVLLSFMDTGSSFTSLVPGMVVLGAGVGLFYSSITTAGVTALDPSRSSLAGGIVYMCQIAGGAVGLAVNTAIVLAAANQAAGISLAFRVDAALALLGLLIVLRYIEARDVASHHVHLPWHLRAHP